MPHTADTCVRQPITIMTKPLYITETPTSFKLQFGYNEHMVALIKRIPSCPQWHPSEKEWVVPKISSEYPEFRPAGWYVDEFAKWSLSHGFCSKIQRDTEEAEIEYEEPRMAEFEGEHHMLLNPYPYQLEGVRYALDHKRCIFGDQPGLGKTLQAICAVVKAHKEAGKYGETFPVLVVCPAALKMNWQREFKKFAGIEAIILEDRNRNDWHKYYDLRNGAGEPIAPVFITNYESLGKFFVVETKRGARGTLKSIMFDSRVKMFRSVILDESHKCKSAKTQQSKFAEGICKGKKWVFALTGTPVVNNNTDLIQQLNILGRIDEFGGTRKFTERYCAGPRQSSHIGELKYRMRQSCFFRREKKKVLSQLPDKMRQYVTCEITNRREYSDAEKDLIGYLREYRNASEEEVLRAMRGEIMVRMGILKQIAARGKIKAVSEFVHDVIDGGEKLVLFAYLRDVVSALKEEFPDAVTVTGSDTAKQKQAAVDAFQNDPDCKLIILNYKSGGTGLTLTAASRVGFIEFPWTYSDCEQAEDRTHRNGQKNAVNCYYFIGDNTIDRYMQRVIQTKRDIADEVTGTTTQIEENVIDITMNLFRDKLI